MHALARDTAREPEQVLKGWRRTAPAHRFVDFVVFLQQRGGRPDARKRSIRCADRSAMVRRKGFISVQ
jgi:hypothetical protein